MPSASISFHITVKPFIQTPLSSDANTTKNKTDKSNSEK